MAKAQATDNAARMKKQAARIAEQVKRGAGKGANAARVFLVARIKEEVSVPAPYTKAKVGQFTVYRATTKAVPWAPPRKLSGALRMSIGSKMITPSIALIWVNAKGLPSKKYPQGFPYPLYHEVKQGRWKMSGRHRFIEPTRLKWRRQLVMIMGQQQRSGSVFTAKGG